MAYIVVAFIVMAFVVMYMVMDHLDMACIGVAFVVMACTVMAYEVIAYVVMAYVVMAYLLQQKYGPLQDVCTGACPCVQTWFGTGFASMRMFSHANACLCHMFTHVSPLVSAVGCLDVVPDATNLGLHT